MVTVAEIRARYPNPKTVKEAEEDRRRLVPGRPVPDAYCVGGALCRAIDTGSLDTHRFPGSYTVAEILTRANPALCPPGAPRRDFPGERFSMAIIRANDASDFEGAWALAERAFTWKEGEPLP